MDSLLDSVRGHKDLLIFLDYDGTLSEIVTDPSRAFLSPSMRETLSKLVESHSIAVVTGRKEATIRAFISPLDSNIILATSHGLEIFFPDDSPLRVGAEFLAPLQAVKRRLDAALPALPPGVTVEDNALSVSLHYRQVRTSEEILVVENLVDSLTLEFPTLRKALGKCVFEFRPRLDWHKGRAVEFIHRKFLGKFPVYLGDDVTDEDAFEVVNRLGGISVQIGNHKASTHAQFILPSVLHVENFLNFLLL